MKYRVLVTEYHNNKNVGVGVLDEFPSRTEADNAICEDVSKFRDLHDNDERIDWNIVEVYDDVGNTKRFEWTIDNL